MDNIIKVYVEAIKMPNGEIIHQGKTLGYFANSSISFMTNSFIDDEDVIIIKKI